MFRCITCNALKFGRKQQIQCLPCFHAADYITINRNTVGRI